MYGTPQPAFASPKFAWALVGLLALLGGGCWGSASESPWPAEPADVDLGPAGEAELTNPPKSPENKRAPGDKEPSRAPSAEVSASPARSSPAPNRTP